MAAEHRSITYRVETSSELNQRAAATAEVSLQPNETNPDDIVVSGPCPECRGTTLHIEPVRLLRSTTPVKSQDVEVICACPYAHDESPAAVTGCGRSWTLHVEWDSV